MHVALLGTGEMGSRMAAALLRNGHRVTVWNRTKDRATATVSLGAVIADTPAAAVKGVEVALAMVRDDDASKQVWLAPNEGALTNLSSDTIAIDSSTLSIEWVRTLAIACAKQGVAFLDAPVIGSRAQADASQLIHLVGGDDETLKRAAPVLAAIGSVAHHVGGNSAGAALKLMVNAMLGVQVALLGELLGACARLGLNATRAVETLVQTPPCSPAAKMAAEAMLKRSFAPAFPVELMEKDMGYWLNAIESGAVPLSTTARAVFKQALRSGLGTENMTAVAKLYERRL